MRMICVDDGPCRKTGQPSGLVKWKEYDVSVCTDNTHGERCGGLLVPSSQLEGCFFPKRFRPIHEVDVAAIFKCEELIGKGV